MKKRIFAVFMAVFALFSCMVVTVGAEETYKPLYENPPYYLATISVGDAFDYQVLTDLTVFYYGFVSTTVKGNGPVEEMSSIYGGGFHEFGFYPDGAWNTTLQGNIVVFYYGAEDDGLAIVEQNGVVVEIATNRESYTQPGSSLSLFISPWGYPDYSDPNENDNPVWGEPVEYEPDEMLSVLRSLGFDVTDRLPLTYTNLIGYMFENFGIAVVGLANGVKGSASELIFDIDDGTRSLSNVVQFIFIIAGISIAMTVFYMIFRLIRFNRQR